MTTSATEPLLRVELLPLSGPTRDELSDLGLPPDVINSWSRTVEPMERTAVVARRGEVLAGAALGVSRSLSAYVKIAGLWLVPGAGESEVERVLLEHIEAEAWRSGAVVVKWEFERGDATVLTPVGYTPVRSPSMPAPIPDVIDRVPGAAFRWRRRAGVTSVPYMRQTTDFTCGPAAVLMALSHFGLHPRPDRDTEISLWREATLVEACDPYGLALAAARRGLTVELTITTDEFVLLEGLPNEQARDVRQFIQSGFRRQVVQAGIGVTIGAFSAADVRAVIESGRLAIILIDEKPFHGESGPHWILAHGIVDDVFLIHDPWTEVMAGETWLDGYDLPMRPADLDRVAAFGDPAYTALLAVGVQQ